MKGSMRHQIHMGGAREVECMVMGYWLITEHNIKDSGLMLSVFVPGRHLMLIEKTEN